jgi:uncharacterized membrane protein
MGAFVDDTRKTRTDTMTIKTPWLMALLLTVVVTVCFIASLLPFMLPGAVIGLLGKVLNDALGDPMWAFVPAVRGTLVASGSEGPMLTLRGVLALYVPLLVVLLWSQRGR